MAEVLEEALGHDGPALFTRLQPSIIRGGLLELLSRSVIVLTAIQI